MSGVSAKEPALRLARAAIFAMVCLVVSAAGHGFAGGGQVGPTAFAVGALGAFALAFALNGRERAAEVVLATTTVAQLLLHELFARSAPGMVAQLGQHHGHLTFGMTLVHLVVAMLTGWWMYRGESAVWLMLRLYAMAPLPVLRRLFAVATGTFTPVRQAVPAPEPVPHVVWEIAAAIHRRGPPAPTVAG